MSLKDCKIINPKDRVIIKEDGTSSNIFDEYKDQIVDKEILLVYEGSRKTVYKIGFKISAYDLDAIVVEHKNNYDECGLIRYTEAIRIPDQEKAIELAGKYNLSIKVVSAISEVHAEEFSNILTPDVLKICRRNMPTLTTGTNERKRRFILGICSGASLDLITKIEEMSNNRINDISRFLHTVSQR